MAYEVKKFENILGIAGFSEQLLKNHLALYEGYVANVNKLDDETEKSPEYIRRFGWEFNGMRLHELYFGNLTRALRMIDEKSDLFKAIIKNFGSYEFWQKDFKAMGASRGVGWVVLYQDGDRLFNVWINEHDTGHLAGAKPLLVMDVFEHAYMLDYGIKRVDYIENFFKAIDWETTEKRF